ncbi:leucine-rich repeat and guanylate kinase domain-containing protein-like [Hippocampus comes]|uniref:leucine-rich repeat and guanylate kinase domain-containing protein-like n=1 Tax=Hippocampus comes TaxID=109280 RepID=UPI00094F1EDB|nr:PREDICTED: leucine-rich repeat and guanylate kinase domain-containing protein-like [Hippocampus comes]
MPFLVILDVSHNEISDFFGFDPPKNLKEVNFSYNILTQMKDMSAYEALVKLELDHNRLKRIHGLEKCCKLTYLSVAHNTITSICSLDDVPLKDLNLVSPWQSPRCDFRVFFPIQSLRSYADFVWFACIET